MTRFPIRAARCMRLTTAKPVDAGAGEMSIAQLVHKFSEDECFLASMSTLDDAFHRALIEIPGSHHYFGDGYGAVVRDPMFLNECARQAATLVAHQVLGVSRTDSFLINSWTFACVSRAPIEQGSLTADVSVIRIVKNRRGNICGSDIVCIIRASESEIASVEIKATYVTPQAYSMLRSMRNPNPAVVSDPHRRPVLDPNYLSFGRLRAENCTLSGAGILPSDPRTLSLNIDEGHRTFFDHQLDHIPAMVLFEAALQAARSAFPTKTVYRFETLFESIIELSTPVAVTARALSSERAEVVFLQEGRELNVALSFERGNIDD